MTQHEAAQALRPATELEIGFLVSCGILKPAILADDGSEGVTRDSVERELSWRASASFPQKLRRTAGNFFRWF
jgi:hypothetical protein